MQFRDWQRIREDRPINEGIWDSIVNIFRPTPQQQSNIPDAATMNKIVQAWANELGWGGVPGGAVSHSLAKIAMSYFVGGDNAPILAKDVGVVMDQLHNDGLLNRNFFTPFNLLQSFFHPAKQVIDQVNRTNRTNYQIKQFGSGEDHVKWETGIKAMNKDAEERGEYIPSNQYGAGTTKRHRGYDTAQKDEVEKITNELQNYVNNLFNHLAKTGAVPAHSGTAAINTIMNYAKKIGGF